MPGGKENGRFFDTRTEPSAGFFLFVFCCQESRERNQGKDARPRHGFLHERNRKATESHMRIGYARVSTHDQNLDLQKDALKKAGCEKIIIDVASGKKTQRSGLDQVLEVLRKGDRLVVWRRGGKPSGKGGEEKKEQGEGRPTTQPRRPRLTACNC